MSRCSARQPKNSRSFGRTPPRKAVHYYGGGFSEGPKNLVSLLSQHPSSGEAESLCAVGTCAIDLLNEFIN